MTDRAPDGSNREPVPAADATHQFASPAPATGLQGVRAVLLVGAVKGGVGKSTLAVNLAAAAALKGLRVGLIDANPGCEDVARLLGVKPPRWWYDQNGRVEPLAGPLGLRLAACVPEGGGPLREAGLASVGEQWPPGEDAGNEGAWEPVAALRRLFESAALGPLDLVVVDLARGFRQLTVLAGCAAQVGILLVSQGTALCVSALRNAVTGLKRGDGRLLGIVETMAGFSCEACHTVKPLFPDGHLAGLGREMALSVLARLPFDPRFAESSDRGLLFIRQYPDTPLAKQLVTLSEGLCRALGLEGAQGPGLSASR
jgi:ATP-binding protein involved in chromosome partitioning